MGKTKRGAPLMCVSCGCTDGDPCVDPETGETCSWITKHDRPMCSFCVDAGADEPMVLPYTEAEADEFIEEMRRGPHIDSAGLLLIIPPTSAFPGPGSPAEWMLIGALLVLFVLGLWMLVKVIWETRGR